VSSMNWMFGDCLSLSSIPLFDTTKVKDMNHVFYRCKNVQYGALALYQNTSARASSIAHTQTFAYCGINTETGSAELAQIPSGWK
jgi:hypothetical protein